MREDEFVVIPGQLLGNRVPDPVDFRNLGGRRVLGKIIGIIAEDAVLNPFDFLKAVRLYPGLHGSRHPADNQILTVSLFQRNSAQLRDWLISRPRLCQCKIFHPVICRQKLGKTHREHLQPINLSHRERDVLMLQFNAEKGTCTHDMQLRQVFTEIFQAGNCSWAGLNLIQDQNGAAGCYLKSEENRTQFPQDAFRIKVIRKQFCRPFFLFKVQIGDFLELLLRKLFHDICFSALTDAGNQQRPAVGAILPGKQLFFNCSFHVPPPRYRPHGRRHSVS